MDALKKWTPYRHGMQWGHWQLNMRTWTLGYRGSRERYEIDLESMHTSAQMLDTIFQVTTKPWCAAQDAGHLIEALRAVCDPQANLCPCGIDKRFSLKEHVKKLRTS